MCVCLYMCLSVCPSILRLLITSKMISGLKIILKYCAGWMSAQTNKWPVRVLFVLHSVCKAHLHSMCSILFLGGSGGMSFLQLINTLYLHGRFSFTIIQATSNFLFSFALVASLIFAWVKAFAIGEYSTILLAVSFCANSIARQCIGIAVWSFDVMPKYLLFHLWRLAFSSLWRLAYIVPHWN